MTAASPSALGVLVLGFGLGLRHALDVDHVAAVSAIVSRRPGLWSASAVGALWGLGHTCALLAVALLVVVAHVEIPGWLAPGLEIGVAAMLIGLGVNLFRTLRQGGTLHVHRHRHGVREHVHLHAHGHAGAHGAFHHAVPGARRPFCVGVVHGLAGSAGLMLAVVATIPSRALALCYVVTFGCGSIGGMLLMSLVLGVPATLAADRGARLGHALQLCAAACCVGVGMLLAWRVGVDAGVFA